MAEENQNYLKAVSLPFEENAVKSWYDNWSETYDEVSSSIIDFWIIQCVTSHIIYRNVEVSTLGLLIINFTEIANPQSHAYSTVLFQVRTLQLNPPFM